MSFGDVNSAFGLGRGGAPGKSKLLVDMVEGQKKFNAELTKTVTLSEKVAKAFKTIKGGGSGNSMDFGSTTLPPISGSGTKGFLDQGTVPGGSVGPGGFIQPSSDSMSFGKSMLANLPGLAANVATGLGKIINPSDYITNEIMRQRFGFFAGVTPNDVAMSEGRGAGSMAFKKMNEMGTPISAMDAANAAMLGASRGLMPGTGARYENVMRGAAGVSNVTGLGLEAGMGAMASLQSAQSVNKLRMIGINIRGNDGSMKTPEDAAKEIWKLMQRSSSGDSKGAITAEDISISAEPGGWVYGILEQYFSGDPALRQAVLSYLYQFASGKGTSKAGLKQTGARPGIVDSMAKRNAKEYNLLDKYTSAGNTGTMAANEVIGQAADTFANATGVFKAAVDILVAGTTGAQTLGGAGNGGVGDILGGAMSFGLGSFMGAGGLGKAKTAFGNAKGKVAPGGKFDPKAAGNWAKGAGKSVLKAGSKLGKAVPVVGSVLAGLNLFSDIAEGDWRSVWGDVGSIALGLLGGAAGSAVAPGLGTAAGYVGGSMLGDAAGTGLYDMIFGKGGDGEGGTGVGGDEGLIAPVDNYSSNITSRWHQVRTLTIGGKTEKTKPHDGIDIGVKEGTPVRVPKSGKIIRVGNNEKGKGFGKYVIVQHNDGYQTLYGHLSQQSVAEGQQIPAGTQLGLSGNTGYSDGPHLHFQVQKKINPGFNDTVDPMKWLSGSVNANTSKTSDDEAPGMHKETDNPVKALYAIPDSKLFAPSTSSGGQGGDGGTSISGGAGTNYGGVTVNINVPSSATINEQTLAQEVRRVLQDDERIRMAVNR